MTSKDWLYLVLQVVCIGAVTLWLVRVLIRLRRMPYSFWYMGVRAVFYRDTQPVRWLWHNMGFFYYGIKLVGLLSADFALIEQITDKTVYSKSIMLFVSTICIAVASIKIMHYVKLNDNGTKAKF